MHILGYSSLGEDSHSPHYRARSIDRKRIHNREKSVRKGPTQEASIKEKLTLEDTLSRRDFMPEGMFSQKKEISLYMTRSLEGENSQYNSNFS